MNMDSLFPAEARLTSAVRSLPDAHRRRLASLMGKHANTEARGSRREAFWIALGKRMTDPDAYLGGPGSYLSARGGLWGHEEHALAVLVQSLGAESRAASQRQLAAFWDALGGSIEDEIRNGATTVMIGEPFFRKITRSQREKALGDAWERQKEMAGDDFDAAVASCERFMEAHEAMVAGCQQ